MLPLVVQIERIDQHKATTHAFLHSPVRIGRNPLNDLVLDPSYVSQWHAVVRFDEVKTYYVDLGATNPTVVDGKPLAKHVEIPVDENVDVRIGNIRFHFLRAPAPAELIRAVKRDSAFSLIDLAPPDQFDPTNCLKESQEAAGRMREPSRVQEPPTAYGTPAFGPREVMQSPAPPVRPERVSARPSGAVAVVPPAVITVGRPTDKPRSAQPSATSVPTVQDDLSPAAGFAGRAAAPDPVFTDRIRSILERLEPYDKAYRYARSNFVEQIERETQIMTSAQRELFAVALNEQYPDGAYQQGYQERLRAPQLGARTGAHLDLEDWLRRLTSGLFPPLVNPSQLIMAMERAGAILEVFSQAFVELRNTHEQFSREMGLTLLEEESPLHRAADPRAILAYLLDPAFDGDERIEELSRVFAEFALHHVALLKATVEGARSLMQRISPESIEDDPTLRFEADEDHEGLFSRVFPYEARKMWKRYQALYQKLAEEDRFTKELFGRAFARAYYTFTGGRISKPSTY